MGFSSARLAPDYFRSALIFRDDLVCGWAVAICSWIADTQLIDSRPLFFLKKSKEHESTTQTTTTWYRSLHQTKRAPSRGVEAAANPLRS